jgi:hypothetical protein
MKIKEWPIVLTCSLQYWRRTGEWSAILPFYSLDRREGSEVGEAECDAIESGRMSEVVLSSVSSGRIPP